MVELLKFETEALNRATMVREICDLDCIVCPYLKVKGSSNGHINVRCHHPEFLVPVRLKGQLHRVPKWCPRRKIMQKEIDKTTKVVE